MSKRDSIGRFKEGNQYSKGHGRPKGKETIAGILKEIGNEPVPDELKERVSSLFTQSELGEITMMEAILRTTVMYAVQGKQWAVQFIADRTEGRPIQTIGVIDAEEEPIKLFEFENNAVED